MTPEDIKQLISKAESGDIKAMYALAINYRDGGGVKQDFEKFLHWYTRLYDSSSLSAKIKSILSFEGRSEDELNSFVKWTKKSAAKGSTTGCHYLAILYLEGIGIQKDSREFVSWLRKAIMGGDARSMRTLALAYRDGIGVEDNSIEYFKWLNKAIEAGDVNSMNTLALAYRDGVEVERNLHQYITWLRKAAKQGNSFAMNSLGIAYLRGDGVKKDLGKYIEWLHKSITAGNSMAMCNLAEAYWYGSGVMEDHEQYMSWLFKAAEAGFDEYASSEIKWLYDERKFNADNLDDCITWLTRAAVIEDANLFFELALKHKERDQTGDDEKFHHWLKEAENLGNIGAFILRALDSAQESKTLNQSIISQLMAALVELSQKVETIKQQHLISDSDIDVIHVAHFTTLEALHSMLPVGEESHAGETCLLRLYNIAYMNDPQEGRRLRDIEHKNSKLLNQFFTATEQGNNHNFLWEGQEVSVYCGSFTLRVDRLDLWRAYGRDGLGYCLVIPSKTFQQESKSNPRRLVHDALHREEEKYIVKKVDQRKVPALYRIRYQQGEAEDTLATLSQSLNKLHQIKQQVNDELSKQINTFVRIIISDILYLYKNEEYASEEEARMIVAHNIADKVLKLDDRQPPRIYVETDAFLFRDAGTRIIIGPKVADKVAAELNLKYRLARHGLLKTTSVEWSKVKYR